jgi:hypothetical protein
VRVTVHDVVTGRVDLSRLAEQRGGWLGASRRDPAERERFRDEPTFWDLLLERAR